jgi:hypothetical protein
MGFRVDTAILSQLNPQLVFRQPQELRHNRMDDPYSRFLAKFLPLLIHLDTQGLISVLFPLLRMHTQGLIRRLPLLLHLDTRGLISVLSLLLRPLLLRLDIQGLISVLRPLLRPQTQGLIRIHAAKPLPQKLPPMCSPVLYLLRSRVDSRA